MNNKIIICGGNGAGKSTLGKALSLKTGWIFKDIEDYYFPKSNSEYPYEIQRTEEEVIDLLYKDLCKEDNLIFASVRGNHNPKTAAMFTCAVFVSVPKEIRMKRVRERSYAKFGDRALEGGDLYEREEAFFNIVKNRTDKTVTDWLETMDIPIITVDGTKKTEENIITILKELSKINQLPYYP